MRVMISSTFVDLKEHRAALYEALVAAGYDVERMEDFSSTGMPGADTCIAAVDGSDVLIVLVGHRYGSVEPSLGIAYTDLEYERAQAVGKPIFAYFRAGLDEGLRDTDESADHVAKLRKLRTTIKSELVVPRAEFEDLEQLVERALSDLEKWTEQGIGRPAFGDRKAAIESAVAYASKSVLRKHAELLAPRVVLVDVSAGNLPKTPAPHASRLAMKLWTIKRELENGGYQAFIFTDFPAVDSDERSFLEQRAAYLRASGDAVAVCFVKDEDDLQALEEFRDLTDARLVYFRDAAPDDFPALSTTQFTGAELSSCALAVSVEESVVDYISRKVLGAFGSAV